jgi:heat shock protein HslJ
MLQHAAQERGIIDGRANRRETWRRFRSVARSCSGQRLAQRRSAAAPDVERSFALLASLTHLLLGGCAGAPVPEPMAGRSAGQAPAPFVAGGNEPGWHLEVDAQMLRVSLDYGTRELVARNPVLQRTDRHTVWQAAANGHQIRVTAEEVVCRDTMSGMPHPYRVTLDVDARVLHGCGGEPRDLLVGPEWVIERLNGRAVLDGSRPTVEFDEEGQIGGHSSCNHYGGTFTLTGESLTAAELHFTLMACVDAELMRQEQRIIAIVENLQRFDIDATGALVLYAANERSLTARRP